MASDWEKKGKKKEEREEAMPRFALLLVLSWPCNTSIENFGKE